jgi:hypothetical protein
MRRLHEPPREGASWQTSNFGSLWNGWGEVSRARAHRAPRLSIEILSPEDQIRKSAKCWLGVPHVWVIDPVTFESDLHTASGCRKLEDGILRIKGTAIEVPLPAGDEDSPQKPVIHSLHVRSTRSAR